MATSRELEPVQRLLESVGLGEYWAHFESLGADDDVQYLEEIWKERGDNFQELTMHMPKEHQEILTEALESGKPGKI